MWVGGYLVVDFSILRDVSLVRFVILEEEPGEAFVAIDPAYHQKKTSERSDGGGGGGGKSQHCTVELSRLSDVFLLPLVHVKL